MLFFKKEGRALPFGAAHGGRPGRGRRAAEAVSASRGGRFGGRFGGRPRALAAVLLAAVLALALAGAAVAAGTGSAGDASRPMAGGTAVGVLLDASPTAPGQDAGDRQSGDTYLDMLVAPGTLAPRVAFWSRGVEVAAESVPFGSAVDEPARPEWSWLGDGRDLGFVRGEDAPVFAGWCLKTAGGSGGDGAGAGAANGAGPVYDFSTPVTGDLALYAAWEDASGDADGGLLTVRLDAAGGSLTRQIDPVTGHAVDPAAAGGTVLERRAGQPWRWLPEPARQGYAFTGWLPGAAGEGATAVRAEDAVDAAALGEPLVLTASWRPAEYTVVYIDRPDGKGNKIEVPAVYGEEKSFLTWEAAESEGLTKPQGKKFAGWRDEPDGGGEWHAGGSPMEAELADRDGARVALYAQWEDEELKDRCEVVLHYGYAVAGADPVVLNVKTGTRLAEADGYVEPKRAGYQFAGWRGREDLSGNEWPASSQVLSDLELWAKWDLRLDVTVPVSVGFAVDADTGEATGPDEGRYALKSRTVAPVVVEEAALESRQDELEGFFELKDGAAGAGVGEGGSGGAAAWRAALEKTALSLGAGGETVALPFAGTSSTDEDGAAVWDSEHPLTDTERAAFRMEPFAYGGMSADDEWQGGLPCKTLPLKLGLTVPIDELKVRTDLDGPQKVTRLVLTVSARQEG